MWYHVSKAYLGKSPILLPRLPRNGNLKIIKWEGNIPRICVSNSLFNCLLAIHGTESLNSNDLYFTENPCVYFTEETPYLPPDCNDFRQNNEMWFLKKTKFYYLARIDMLKLFTGRIIVPTDDKELKLPPNKVKICKVNTRFLTNLTQKTMI